MEHACMKECTNDQNKQKNKTRKYKGKKKKNKKIYNNNNTTVVPEGVIPKYLQTIYKQYTDIHIYLTLCTFSFEINESSLSDTRCCITTLW